VLLKERDLLFELFGTPGVVGVENRDQVPRGEFDAAVFGGVGSQVLGVGKNFDSRIVVGSRDLDAIVLADIIEEEQFPVVIGLV
jgi:hypothetical protein